MKVAARVSDMAPASGSAHFIGNLEAEDSVPLWEASGQLPFVRFDPLRRAGSVRMKAAVRGLAAFLQAREAELGLRRRARNPVAQESFRCAVETIACNLVWSTLDPLGRPAAVPRDNSAMWRGDRYAHACFGKGFLDALGLMARPDVALIDNISTGFSYKGGSSAPSTVRPTAAFLSRFSPPGVTWRDFRRVDPPEVLVLKAPKEPGAETSKPLDYLDTTRTRQLRREVQRVNRFLADAPFWFEDDAGPLGLDSSGAQVDPNRRTVRRIFNNAEWTDGGRLYDGTWETMRRADRFRLLRIGSAQHPEGEPVCNVNFRSLNPILCYVLAGLPVPEGDLYDIRGDWSCRAGFKVLVSAMLFAPRRFRQMPVEAQKAFPPGTVTREVVDAVERHHAPIAHRFWTGYGHRLANVESAILLDALADLNGQGVTALPLHDSVLVARSQGERAKQALETAFSRFSEHHRAAVNIDYGEQ
jgi:hypothetical protein